MTSGVVVWITGLPSAGKSTFADHLRDALFARGESTCVLDGDAVRACLVPRPGYSAEERASFYETLAGLAALVARQGLVVLVPATANQRRFRERGRDLAPAFVEIWIDTPLGECAARDTKGLYGAARDGGAQEVPGADAAYEPPGHADVVASGGLDAEAVERAVAQILRVASGATQESQPNRD